MARVTKILAGERKKSGREAKILAGERERRGERGRNNGDRG